jgi:hypothetical protein
MRKKGMTKSRLHAESTAVPTGIDNTDNAIVRPKVKRMARASNGRAILDDATRSTASTSARKAHRAKIESLLDRSTDARLAEAWQRVYPFPIDPAYELPGRRGIIEDLADFAEVLHLSLHGMKAERLCRLVENYAAYKSRQSDLPVSQAVSPRKSRKPVRGRRPLRTKAAHRDDQVVSV